MKSTIKQLFGYALLTYGLRLQAEADKLDIEARMLRERAERCGGLGVQAMHWGMRLAGIEETPPVQCTEEDDSSLH